jgi:hypothetical protein
MIPFLLAIALICSLAACAGLLVLIRLHLHDAPMIRRVDRVLLVWAEHWGEPADCVKPLLLQAIKDSYVPPTD